MYIKDRWKERGKEDQPVEQPGHVDGVGGATTRPRSSGARGVSCHQLGAVVKTPLGL